MAAIANGSQEAFAPVLTAMSTMRDGQREQKQAAHLYLEKFQKSVGCDWMSLPPLYTTELTAMKDRGMADYDWDPTVQG
jgi:hypothetical protein